MNTSNAALEKLSHFVLKQQPNLSFSIVEVGAVPIDNQEEPFYSLLDFFPQSTLAAFELDETLCETLNQSSRKNVTYYPTAIGGSDEEHAFYETNESVCCSLYKPNDALLAHYNGLDMSMLKSEQTITTTCLDSFASQNKIDTIDFIKLDIQGAELDAFKGGKVALENTLMILSEVEFIPLYIDQPLFGDVCRYLDSRELMFHKFLGVGGRSIKPAIIQKDINIPTQLMWADAIFIKPLDKLDSLSSDQLLKLGILGFMYKSPDLTFRCFQVYDARNNTNLSQEYLRLGT